MGSGQGLVVNSDFKKCELHLSQFGFAGGDTNLYAYAEGDPMSYVDPDGKFAIALIPFIPAIVDTAIVVGSAIVGGWSISELMNWYSKKSGKEKASDIPSWAQGEQALPGEKPKDTADRIVKEKRGPNYPKGPGSEYNKIKKYYERKDCP